MTPLFDRLLVRKKPNEIVTTEAGLELDPSKLGVAHERGEITHIGDKITNENVKIGEVGLFARDSGSPILMPTGEILYLLREEQIDIIE